MSGQTPRLNGLRQLRHRLGPAIDRVAEAIGRPVDHVHPAGYVGTVRLPLAELEGRLDEAGFAWDPVSLYHYTPTGNSANGSWAYRSSPLADRQRHVVLFDQGTQEVDAYAHAEYSWLRHPIKHAAQENIRHEPAVNAVRRCFDEQNVPYDRRSRAARTVKHRIERIRRRW